MYICVYLDLYSRKVLAYNYGRNPSTNLATRTIKEAVRKERPSRGLILHTDNGGAYTSYSMSRIAAHFGITQSFSHPGAPHDNAVAEAFFHTLKKECIYRNGFKSEAEFRKELDSYTYFYNNQREQHYLRYHSPVQFELQMA
ncbi:MAG: IS3 family transposase [Candidatus Saccharibacteria bacterium]|nr:IS3 family transposase [Candidatus Saccharibacteria bacterium]